MKTTRSVLAVFAAAMFLLPAFAPGSTAVPGSTDVRYLSGTGADDAVTWNFYCSEGRRGGEWAKIRVPSCWEQEGFGAYFYGAWARGRTGDAVTPPAEQGKYRTAFTVPAAWKGTAVRIVFAGVMTDAEVIINGKSAGPVHQGGFYQFEYDVSALLRYGGAENTLEVNVSKESANASVNTAERRGDYWTFGGIYRPVWLESRPAHHIERVAIDARANGSFGADIFRDDSLARFGGTVTAQVYDAADKPVGELFKARFAKNETKATVRGKVESPQLWTAETPNIYTMRFVYSADASDGAAHEYTQRFGFRTVEVRPGDGVYVNGVKIILKGINRHSFRPENGRTLTRGQCYDDVRLIQEMNMNAVRMSHYPPDAAFLEACDELGLYVINELAGWQGAYDTPTAARLTGELVRRDVNHPSILFWANGNEGGWNVENDGEFAKWDPQGRNVLHPWELHGNINTKHYPKYDLLEKLCAGKDIFMPTEFLHGLYDGGIGSGFSDYWKIMSASPVCAGGFIWVFADEGIVRTDQSGRIDNSGNLAPDGIVGPHHEREGSFYTVKELWSPVTLANPSDNDRVLPPDWDGVVALQNNYAFTNLDQCVFRWRVIPAGSAQRATGGGIAEYESGEIAGPNIAPGGKGALKITMPRPLPADSIVRLSASTVAGRELWTWSWFTGSSGAQVARSAQADAPPRLVVEGPQILVTRGALVLRFDRQTGQLYDVALEGRTLPLAAGPALTAFVRDNRRFTDLMPPPNDLRTGGGVSRGKVTSRVEAGGSVVIEAVYPAKNKNALSKVVWTIPPGAVGVRLDYEYNFEGKADLLGVRFELPESAVLAKRWLGRGPHRVYRNRMEGGVLGVYEQSYNDPVPGRTYVAEAEFKGYFRDWRWLELTTTGGRLTLENNGPAGSGTPPFIGLWRPRDGVPPMLDIPDTGLALLDVIPAQANKFENGGNSGPQAATPALSSKRTGSITLNFSK